MRCCVLLIFACALLEVPIIKSEEGSVLSEESRQDAFVTFKDKGGATDIAIHLPFTQCPMRALIFLATLACCMTTVQLLRPVETRTLHAMTGPARESVKRMQAL